SRRRTSRCPRTPSPAHLRARPRTPQATPTRDPQAKRAAASAARARLKAAASRGPPNKRAARRRAPCRCRSSIPLPCLSRPLVQGPRRTPTAGCGPRRQARTQTSRGLANAPGVGQGRATGLSCSLDKVRQEPEKARPLDRLRELALLLGRDRRDAARHNLAAFGNVAPEQPHVLEVDLRRLIAREGAGLASAVEKPPRRDGRRFGHGSALLGRIGFLALAWRTRGARCALAIARLATASAPTASAR